MTRKTSLPQGPGTDVVALVFPERNVSLQKWKEYSFTSNFLTPTDGWSFTTTKPSDPDLKKALVSGELVHLMVNNFILSTGYIDAVECTTSRENGTELRISGRDRLAQVVDANVNPTLSIKPGMSLAEVMKQVFGPYGWPNDADFALAEESDELALSTEITGVKVSKKGIPLKSFQLGQHHPLESEGAFDFAKRIANRQGLWIWLSNDGETVIVGKPSFDLGEVADLFVGDRATNVLSSTVRRDLSGQPSVVVATGFHFGGPANERTEVGLYAFNPGVRVKGKFDNALPTGWADPGGRKVDMFPQPTALLAPYERPLFLHDPEAQTSQQLEHYVRRELSQMMRNAVTVNCTVLGHGFLSGGDGSLVPWSTNTMVNYRDDNAEIDEPMWILGRTFKRSRGGGTTTDLELIRPNTLDF